MPSTLYTDKDGKQRRRMEVKEMFIENEDSQM